MSAPVKTQQELYQLFLDVLQDLAPDLDDVNDGSTNDTLAGVFSLAATELTRLTIDRFNKTFFSLAGGPDETGGPDDLQTLAVDHFGDDFARPQAVQAVDTVTFSRPTNAAGEIVIPAGTIVKTVVDANGEAQRYSTDSDVTLTNTASGTDLTGSANVTAVVAGAAGSATAGTITVIETSLLDTTITVTNAGNSTGSDAQDTPTYLQTIRNLIAALAGATKAAIEAKSKTVTGVVTATAIERAKTVIEWNVATASPIGTAFRIPVPYLYVADSTGTATAALLQLVRDAIETVRACGILINVSAASAVSVNWTASFTLNPSGPNYTTLVNDATMIKQAMTDYINALPVGTSFVRATANAAMLALYGAAGTDDLTVFTTSIPVGDVAASATTKLIAGTIGVV